jgi:hypothetical protein
MFILDDLRVCWISTIGFFVFDYSTETVNQNVSLTYDNNESAMTNLPDGRVMGYFIDGRTIHQFRPEYNASVVAAGSYSGGGETPVSTYGGNGNLNEVGSYVTVPDGWEYNPAGGTQIARWNDPIAGGNNAEIGPNMYYYKIGKLVMCGGFAGEIFELDPATMLVSSRVKTPAGASTDPVWTNFKVATLSSAHAGQTGAQIVTSGSMTLTWTNATTVRPTYVCLPTTNNRYIFISGTTTTWTGSISAGQSVTFNNLSLGSPIVGGTTQYKGDPNSVIVTSAPANIFAMGFASGEGPAAILPSGKFCYVAGTRYISDVAGFGYVFMWDGTTSSPVKTTLPGGALLYPTTTQMVVLPSGELFVTSQGGGVFLYQDTGATVDSTQKPVVDNIPTTFGQGGTYRVIGKQLTGLHVGSIFGDESPNQSNHTLVRLTKSDGTVYFAPTKNWSYRGIQPNRSSSVEFTITTSIPVGVYDLNVIANGVASDPVSVTVLPALPAEGIFINSYRTT